jgi:nucleoside diphosphate kinase
VWEGEGVVKSARKLIGATNPLEAEPGTIRGDLAVQASACWCRSSCLFSVCLTEGIGKKGVDERHQG